MNKGTLWGRVSFQQFAVIRPAKKYFLGWMILHVKFIVLCDYCNLTVDVRHLGIMGKLCTEMGLECVRHRAHRVKINYTKEG